MRRCTSRGDSLLRASGRCRGALAEDATPGGSSDPIAHESETRKRSSRGRPPAESALPASATGMSFDNTHNVRWRFQGPRSCCWLTSIEMLVQCKHGNVYGPGRTAHSAAATQEFKKNKGSNIELDMADYGLERNEHLRGERSPLAWKPALRLGPVLAEGNSGC